MNQKPKSAEELATFGLDGLDPPTEIIVPTEVIEAMMAKGQLQLSSEQIDQLEVESEIRLPRELWDAANPPTERKPPIEWIEPLDAVHWLSTKLGSDAAAKSAIVERLRDGAIQCTDVWMSMGPDIGPVTDRRPNYPRCSDGGHQTCWVTPVHRGKGPVKLGGAFWAHSDDWEADVKRWDWYGGVFVTSTNQHVLVSADGIPAQEIKSSERIRMVASGVRFSRADIEKICPTQGDSLSVTVGLTAQKTPTSTPRRRRPRSNWWPNWVAELSALIHEDGIPLNQTATGLIEAVKKRLEKDPDATVPSDDAVYDAANAVLGRIRSCIS